MNCVLMSAILVDIPIPRRYNPSILFSAPTFSYKKCTLSSIWEMHGIGLEKSHCLMSVSSVLIVEEECMSVSISN